MTITTNIYITDEILDAVLWVNTLFRGKVTFCGSFGLVAHGILHRPIHDIDCITDDNLYGVFYELIGQYGIGTSNSEKFQVDGIWVLCFKLTAPNGINVDVMYRADGCKSQTAWVHKLNDQYGEIKIEKPESAIEIKRNYLNLAGRTPNTESAEKHKADLEYIDVWDKENQKFKKKKKSYDWNDDPNVEGSDAFNKSNEAHRKESTDDIDFETIL